MSDLWLRLRQICLVASDLDPIVEQLRAIFGLEVCYVDPGVARFGLRNALLPIGDQLLEVVCPVVCQKSADPKTPATSEYWSLARSSLSALRAGALAGIRARWQKFPCS